MKWTLGCSLQKIAVCRVQGHLRQNSSDIFHQIPWSKTHLKSKWGSPSSGDVIMDLKGFGKNNPQIKEKSSTNQALPTTHALGNLRAEEYL